MSVIDPLDHYLPFSFTLFFTSVGSRDLVWDLEAEQNLYLTLYLPSVYHYYHLFSIIYGLLYYVYISLQYTVKTEFTV